MPSLPRISRLAVLSDIHLGRGDAQTGYYGRPEDLCSLLEHIAKDVDLVVINGDLYDLDRGAIPLAQFKEYQYLKGEWSAVEACMKRLDIRTTAGNHDRALLGKTLGAHRVREHLLVPLQDLTVRIEHGERFDAWIKRNRRFTSLFTWLSGWLSRRGLDPLYRILRALEAWSTDDSSGGLVRRAKKWLRTQNELDVLILGHTHTQVAEACGQKWVLNPGDAMHPTAHYVVLDAEEMRVKFFSITQDSAPVLVQQLALQPRIGNAPKKT